MFRFASLALLQPQRETHPFPSDWGRRMDLAFPYRDKSWLVDVALTHSLRAPLISQAAAKPGGGATQYEQVKRNTYQALVNASTQKLVPAVVDCFGAWGASAQPLLQLIGRESAKRSPSGRGEFLTALNHAVMKGIASLLLAICEP